MQNLFAKRILEKQLKHYGIIQYHETIDAYEQLSNRFKNSQWFVLHWMTKENGIWFDLVWADNADVISLQYAGTGALKTDYTR